MRPSKTACPLAAPSIQLEHTRPLRRPAGVLPWSDANLSGLTHTSRFLFSPRQSSPDGWFTAIRASQFPEICGRYLVIEDDLDTAGAGWTASMLNVALAFAVLVGFGAQEVVAASGFSGEARRGGELGRVSVGWRGVLESRLSEGRDTARMPLAKAHAVDVRQATGWRRGDLLGDSSTGNNMPPYLVLKHCVVTQGIFPSRN